MPTFRSNSALQTLSSSYTVHYICTTDRIIYLVGMATGADLRGVQGVATQPHPTTERPSIAWAQ